MAVNETFIAATPTQVWEVLADPESYGEWVVGSKEIRGADPDFPAAGTRFHHTVGFGPLTVKDHTRVVESVPPTFLKLRAKARPLGTAFVCLRLAEEGNGTRVVMEEVAADKLTRLVFNPLTDLLVRERNVEGLRRLKRLAERHRDRRQATAPGSAAG